MNPKVPEVDCGQLFDGSICATENITAVSIPGFSFTGVDAEMKVVAWGVLSGVLAALICFYFLTSRKSAVFGHYSRVPAVIVLLVASLFFLTSGWYYLQHHSTQTINVIEHVVPDALYTEGQTTVRFPATGIVKENHTELTIGNTSYAFPVDGLITSSLLLAIGFFVAATLQNFTTRKRIEKELDNSRIAAQNVLEDLQVEKGRLAIAKAKDEALLESIGEGVIATDQTGNIILVNKVAENLLGFRGIDLIGKPTDEILIIEDAQGNIVHKDLQSTTLALAFGITTINSDSIFVRKDRTKFPVAITATPVLLKNEPAGAIVVFRDITKEKEIDRLRTDFLSLASHQLRTPLSGTKWLIETLEREILGTVNPRQRKYLQNLYQINERMIRLVGDMLNVLQLESGTLTIKHEVIGAPKIFEELLLMMEPVSRSRGVQLENGLSASSHIVIRSDSQIIRSILESFVGNAINYSETGDKVIVNAKEDSGVVLFSVKDNGIGIPQSEQKRIFERFYRSSNAKQFKPDGTGLGLYIAFLLAKKIGGSVYFESAEGKGATFYLCIPTQGNTSAIT